jgi:NAD-dependent DNA ligase
MVLTDQVAKAKVLDVEWTPSTYGYLKPKVRIYPVIITGSKITYATAHNAKFVKDNIVGPGAVIQLIKSGDVIPYIKKVLKPASSGKPKMPTIPYVWNDTGVDIIVKDIHGAAKDNIIIKQLTKFFKVMQVKYISEGIISKLVENEYKDIISILEADKDEVAEIEGLGEKVVKKIYKNIFSAIKKTSLGQLMVASNIFGRGFGQKKIKKILNIYPDIMKKKWKKKVLYMKLLELEGYDTKTAKQFTLNFKNFKRFYNELGEVIDLSHLEKIKKKKKKSKKKFIFEGEKIVFTGFRNKDLEELIEDLGGEVRGSVSSSTTLVVYVQPPNKPKSGKIKKAKKMDIKIMTKDEFMKKYKL